MILCEDLIDCIEGYMDIKTFCNWRLVYRRKWNSTIIKNYARMKLQAAPIEKNKCAVSNCNNQCLTQLYWNDDLCRDFVPWCALHIDKFILLNIDMYCVGDLSVESNPSF